MDVCFRSYKPDKNNTQLLLIYLESVSQKEKNVAIPILLMGKQT